MHILLLQFTTDFNITLQRKHGVCLSTVQT